MGRPKGSRNGIRQAFVVTCASCKKKFEIDPYRYRLETTKCCSKKCQSIWHSRGMQKPTHRICPVCNKEFVTRPSDQKVYCSMLCASKVHGTKITGLKVERIEKICPICSKRFTFRPAENRSFCSKRCANKALIKQRLRLTCQWCHNTFDTMHKDQKYCSKTCRNIALRNIKFSNIEPGMASALYDAGIRFESQYPYFHYIMDFAIPDRKVSIECDGNYWHSFPEAIVRDKKRDTYLKRHGWTVLRFSETEIYKDINSCIARISGQLASSS